MSGSTLASLGNTPYTITLNNLNSSINAGSFISAINNSLTQNPLSSSLNQDVDGSGTVEVSAEIVDKSKDCVLGDNGKCK